MRKIKFRAFSKYSNKIVYWNEIRNNGYDAFEDKNYILLQFTGLKDKNGKEIYEGDIIKRKTDGNIEYHGEYNYQEVVYRNGLWLIQYLKSEKGFLLPRGYTAGEIKDCRDEWDKDIIFGESDYWSTLNIEVVGNIYENPELLKSNQQ